MAADTTGEDGLTYPQVGATAGALPPGYDHLWRTSRLGHGDATFAQASERLLTWEMHRRAGVTVEADAPRVAEGVEVRLGWSWGPVSLTAPCRVVWVLTGPLARGFAYGTLRGHPESGEESFVVRRAPDGAVDLEVVAFSRPARWYSRLGGPVTRAAQRRIVGRYLRALRQP